MISFNLQNAVMLVLQQCLVYTGISWGRLEFSSSDQPGGVSLAFAAVKPHKVFSALSGTAQALGCGVGWMWVQEADWAGSISVVCLYLHVARKRGLSHKKDKQTAVLNEGGQGKTVFLFSQKLICKNKWVQFVIIIYTCLCMPLHLT